MNVYDLCTRWLVGVSNGAPYNDFSHPACGVRWHEYKFWIGCEYLNTGCFVYCTEVAYLPTSYSTCAYLIKNKLFMLCDIGTRWQIGWIWRMSHIISMYNINCLDRSRRQNVIFVLCEFFFLEFVLCITIQLFGYIEIDYTNWSKLFVFSGDYLSTKMIWMIRCIMCAYGMVALM